MISARRLAIMARFLLVGRVWESLNSLILVLRISPDAASTPKLTNPESSIYPPQTALQSFPLPSFTPSQSYFHEKLPRNF